jgi:hypothetical protein
MNDQCICVTGSIQQRSFRFVECFGRYVTRRISGTIRNYNNEGTYNRSGHRDSIGKELVYGSATISSEFDRETNACRSK